MAVGLWGCSGFAGFAGLVSARRRGRGRRGGRGVAAAGAGLGADSWLLEATAPEVDAALVLGAVLPEPAPRRPLGDGVLETNVGIADPAPATTLSSMLW